MSSPERVQIQIQHQIKRRINQDSPTKYDLDFYLRKINRLQNDFNGVQDQLSKARVKLRRAQDFQIKYDLTLKQNTNLQTDISKLQKQLFQAKANNQQLKTKVQDRHTKNQDFTNQRRNLQQEIDKWKTKYQESQDKRTNALIQQKQKSQILVKKQIQLTKRQFADKQQEYQFQIRQLKKTVHQKQTVQNVVGLRVQKIRKQKDEQINRLAGIIEKLKFDHLESMKQKNEQFNKLRQKFQKMFNFQLQNLKKNLDDQDQLFNIQINGLRQMIGLKNDQISKILEQMKRQSYQHQKDRQQLLNQISVLKQKIYTIQRENQIQLYNVKQRLTKIHSLDIEAVEKRYNQLIVTLKGQRGQLQNLVKQKDKIVQSQRKELERVKSELIDRIKQRQGRIKQLTQKLQQTGDMNASQLKTLHQSFHKIQSQKELMSNQYQVNVGFLNQQIAKLSASCQLKNNQIRQLHEEIANLKRSYSESIRDMDLKWKQQRKQRQQQRQVERASRQKVQDEYRTKQRDWKNKERQLQREKQKQQRQKNKLKYIVDQLQRDIQRLNLYIKQLDQNLKNQYKKNQASTLDTGGIRRQLTSQLQRQKNQLEAIKRMEVDQIQKKCEIQITRLTNQNEKLQTDLLNKSLSFDKLQTQFKKLEHINKNIDRINKEKLLQYQKKMATLNNQINLTQNLYQSFLQAKSRNAKKDK